ncbi:hypothetical protein [Pseudomonas luteola]|uniref:hypothetical protein n=1 Tax=Pseudomonas luteola TaxID=47886 RepID=UPI000F7B0C25|nr:hypothetical protein [Pseudomonas luteola]
MSKKRINIRVKGKRTTALIPETLLNLFKERFPTKSIEIFLAEKLKQKPRIDCNTLACLEALCSELLQ